MILPCKTCKFVAKPIDMGVREFIGCSDKTKEAGFQEDNYFYRHSCLNYEVREECSTCMKYNGVECESFHNGFTKNDICTMRMGYANCKKCSHRNNCSKEKMEKVRQCDDMELECQ